MCQRCTKGYKMRTTLLTALLCLVFILYMWMKYNIVKTSSTRNRIPSFHTSDLKVSNPSDLMVIMRTNKIILKEQESTPSIKGPQHHTEHRAVVVSNNGTTVKAIDHHNTSEETIQKGLNDSSLDELDSFKWYMSSKESKPLNPHTYNLLINQSNICQRNGSQLDIFLLVLIASRPEAVMQREKLRNSTLSIFKVSGRNVRYVFLLGNVPSPQLRDSFNEEAAKFGDIVVEDFLDSYNNLTLKTLMGLKWASFYCPQAKYVLKTDDDVYISINNLIQLLVRSPLKEYTTGLLYKKSRPYRNKSSKWYISNEEYPSDFYPPYFSGLGYVMSGDLPPRIFEVSLTIPYVFLEDVFVGLCLQKLNITTRHNDGFVKNLLKYKYCSFKKAYLIHLAIPSEVDQYWVDQQKNVPC